MKTYGWNGTARLAAVIVLAALCVSIAAARFMPSSTSSDARETLSAGPAQHPTPTVTSKVPDDVQIPPNTMNQVVFFDDFSWQAFLALNWPAMEGKRGLADP